MEFSDDLLIALLRAEHIVVFTGAGMSAESGIATFRDAQTGLWGKYDPHVMASPKGYLADKALVWGWYEWRRIQVLQAKPNAGHFAIADLANHVERLTLITQNVDDLHERAGSRSVVHLHGSLHQPRCFCCSSPYTFSDYIPDEPVDVCRKEPPVCTQCNGSIRPGVVWFGESINDTDWEYAEQAAMKCDLIFSIGASLLVWPAAQLAERAILHGAKLIQINPDSTALDSKAIVNFRGKAGEVLPAMLHALSSFLNSFG
jgi:NAD-dependent deacetylase